MIYPFSTIPFIVLFCACFILCMQLFLLTISCLVSQRRQRDQLLEIVRQVGGFGSVCDGNKVEEIERAIKQVHLPMAIQDIKTT